MRRLILPAVLVTGALAIPNIACAQDIKIGFAGALTGPAAYVGLEIKRGAEIAIDEINEKAA
jgi:ABC-type branched-subunit amino acid transport system substrate-binding protein